MQEKFGAKRKETEGSSTSQSVLTFYVAKDRAIVFLILLLSCCSLPFYNTIAFKSYAHVPIFQRECLLLALFHNCCYESFLHSTLSIALRSAYAPFRAGDYTEF